MFAAANAAESRTFAEARTAAFSGQRQKAKDICTELLARDPDDSDTRILLGRLHAWDSEYPQARTELQRVLSSRSTNEDARSALIDVELWSDNPTQALKIANLGLALNPKSGALTYKKARALKALRRDDEAVVAAERSVALAPTNVAAREFLQGLLLRDPLNKVSLTYTHDFFNRGYEPWRIYSLAYSHRFDTGSVIARLNHAERFGLKGEQFEVDAYPRLREGTYMYLNAGFSSASVFPRQRYGAELYQSLPGAWDASFGLRHLIFSASTVNIWTGTVGKYLGNYYFLLRGNLIPDRYGNSTSVDLQTRYYHNDESYIVVAFGGGKSLTYRDSTQDVVALSATHVSVGMYQRLMPRWFAKGDVGYEHEEIRPTTYRDHWTIGVGLETRF